MKCNSTTLFIQSPGAVTPIPWIDDSPDFSAFTEPTLSVLQTAWQEFLDSGEQLEIIPDPELIVEFSTPNWHGLWTSLMMSGVYRHLSELEMQMPQLTGAMGKVLSAMQYGMIAENQAVALAAFQSALDLLFLALGLVSQTLTVEQIAEVRQTLDDNHFTVITLP